MAGTIEDKLALLENTKEGLKAALAEKGIIPSDVFSDYPDMVRAIETGGAAPDTCTVIIEALSTNATFWLCNCFIDGGYVAQSGNGTGTITISDVVCGSSIYLWTTGGYTYSAEGGFNRFWSSSANDQFSDVAGTITATAEGTVKFGWTAR